MERKRRPSAKAEAKRKKTILKAIKKEEWKLQKKKPLEVSIREHIGKILDNTKLLDVAKLGAVLGMTLIVHDVIVGAEELLGAVKKIAFPQIGESFVAPAIIGRRTTPEETARAKEWYEGPIFTADDWKIWLISFTAAYVIIENFGSIFHAASDILSSVKNLVTGLLLGSPIIA